MKIAQIGVGGWGKNHARVLSQLGALVAVCDADETRSKETGQKYNV
ncbi:MAG TPA: gfo/Idh/MocA family oxidoreductase, partial [Candidatus Nitrosotenuis sp.]|nr:gfo/Idh/MocA family oxidoreductase [Candidatus Nitrosotenuis sp.]